MGFRLEARVIYDVADQVFGCVFLHSGLAKADSQSGTQTKVLAKLNQTSAISILLMFGQVDLHIGYLCASRVTSLLARRLSLS